MKVLRAIFLILLGLYFFVPLLAMARFAFQSVPVVLRSEERRVGKECRL